METETMKIEAGQFYDNGLTIFEVLGPESYGSYPCNVKWVETSVNILLQKGHSYFHETQIEKFNLIPSDQVKEILIKRTLKNGT